MPAVSQQGSESEFVNVSGAQESIPPAYVAWWPGGPVRKTGLLYWPARLHRLAKSIPGLLKRLQAPVFLP
jgi:hypothetical protein